MVQGQNFMKSAETDLPSFVAELNENDEVPFHNDLNPVNQENYIELEC